MTETGVPGQVQMSQIFSVCVSVLFFVDPFFECASADMKAISLKRVSKNGVLHGILKGS